MLGSSDVGYASVPELVQIRTFHQMNMSGKGLLVGLSCRFGCLTTMSLMMVTMMMMMTMMMSTPAELMQNKISGRQKKRKKHSIKISQNTLNCSHKQRK